MLIIYIVIIKHNYNIKNIFIYQSIILCLIKILYINNQKYYAIINLNLRLLIEKIIQIKILRFIDDTKLKVYINKKNLED